MTSQQILRERIRREDIYFHALIQQVNEAFKDASKTAQDAPGSIKTLKEDKDA